MHQGRSPIIIDNTNIQAWEMKPYVKMVRSLKVFTYLLTGFHPSFLDPNAFFQLF